MVGDLLDLTRTRLGTGIPITPKPMDLDPVCHQVVAELEAVHPTCKLRFRSKGNLRGEWDADRLQQVISNLVAKAVQYGCEEGPVSAAALDCRSSGAPSRRWLRDREQYRLFKSRPFGAATRRLGRAVTLRSVLTLVSWRRARVARR